jgi:hypothetical protein
MKTWSSVAKVVAVVWAGSLMGGFVYVRAGGVIWQPQSAQPAAAPQRKTAVLPSSKWASVYPEQPLPVARVYPAPTASPNAAVPSYNPGPYTASTPAPLPDASSPKPVRSQLMYSSKSGPVFASGDGPPLPPNVKQTVINGAVLTYEDGPPPRAPVPNAIPYSALNVAASRPPRTAVFSGSKSAAVIGGVPLGPVATGPPAQTVQQPSVPQTSLPPQPAPFVYPKSGTWPVLRQQAVPQTNQPQWQR